MPSPTTPVRPTRTTVCPHCRERLTVALPDRMQALVSTVIIQSLADARGTIRELVNELHVALQADATKLDVHNWREIAERVEKMGRAAL